MDTLLRVSEAVKSFREARLSTIRPPGEFFDYQRISRPADFNEATSRITYNTRYFSGNYSIIIILLAIYAILSSRLLIFAIVFLVGGFIAINRFVTEPLQFGDRTITQKHLYLTLFGIGIPLLLWASPFGILFWIVGASAFVILLHASFVEPGIESEYAAVQDTV